MAKRLKEKDVEKEVCDFAESIGFMQRKYTSPSRIGVPDRLFWGIPKHLAFKKVMGSGISFLIEFKKPGESLDPPQVREIRTLREHGALVGVIDNIEDGVHLVECFMDGRLTARALGFLNAL